MLILSVKSVIRAIKSFGFKFRIDEISSERACICLLSPSGEVFARSNYVFVGYIHRLLY